MTTLGLLGLAGLFIGLWADLRNDNRRLHRQLETARRLLKERAGVA